MRSNLKPIILPTQNASIYQTESVSLLINPGPLLTSLPCDLIDKLFFYSCF